MDRLRCTYCGEIVGVYEPTRLLLADGTYEQGSPLTLDGQLATPGSVVLHERCYQASRQSSFVVRSDDQV